MSTIIDGLNSLDLSDLGDVSIVLSVQVGSTKMDIKEVLRLTPGSIVQLDQAANTPLEIFINDKVLARGEAVVINEKFAIRILEIVDQSPQKKAA